MKNIFLYLTILFCFNACLNNKHNYLTENEIKDGWELMFDGKTLNKWHKYGFKKVGKYWQVKDEILCLEYNKNEELNLQERGDIVFEKEYKNFHLKYDWKISKEGNSGVFFYVNEDTTKYDNIVTTGLEMQILDNENHAGGKVLKHHTGDLFDLISSYPETANKTGEWNKAEIISFKGQLTFFLNGVKILETTLWNEEWFRKIKETKFANFINYGNFKKGKIALQDHATNVYFRNIKIKKL